MTRQFGIVLLGWHSLVLAESKAMPVEQQNLLIQKYCAVCHTDAARNGGLSLQNFDAATVDPSLAAMLVSKMKNGAFGAAGIKPPDAATSAALTSALTEKSAKSTDWSVMHVQIGKASQTTAAILREWRDAKGSGEPSLYRLTITCNAPTRLGEVQLSWSPKPKTGTVMVSVDGNKSSSHIVEGVEKMGNGSAATTGPASVVLSSFKLPVRTMAVSNLFPGEAVEFPFDALPGGSRESLGACFPPAAIQ